MAPDRESIGLRIGIDFGGTKIEGIALDLAGRELGRQRIATPRDDYPGSLAAVAELVEGFEKELGHKGSVGLGIPGCLSPASGLVKNANSTWLIGKDLKGDLEDRLARPVRIENDANCLAVSEAVDGAAAGAEVVFAVILGTGVGGGIAFKGKAWVGPNAVAGEWGHNPLPWPQPAELPGPPCYCGKQGCIETFLSGPGWALDHRSVTGEPLSGPEIVAALDPRRCAGRGELRALPRPPGTQPGHGDQSD